MTRKAILIASLAIAAMPAPALAAGDYSVRNETRHGLSCGLRREGRSAMDRFVLPPGGEWRQATEGEGVRTLICPEGRIQPPLRMRSGVRYALVRLRSGVLALVPRG